MGQTVENDQSYLEDQYTPVWVLHLKGDITTCIFSLLLVTSYRLHAQTCRVIHLLYRVFFHKLAAITFGVFIICPSCLLSRLCLFVPTKVYLSRQNHCRSRSKYWHYVGIQSELEWHKCTESKLTDTPRRGLYIVPRPAYIFPTDTNLFTLRYANWDCKSVQAIVSALIRVLVEGTRWWFRPGTFSHCKIYAWLP